MTKVLSAPLDFGISHSGFFRHSTFGFCLSSAVTLAHHEIERAENGSDVAHHVVRQQPGQDAQVDKGRRADFQTMRRSTALAVDVKAEFALRILRPEINLA